MRAVLDWLFGCSHANASRVFSDAQRGQYQVCLDCGAQLAPKVYFSRAQYPQRYRPKAGRIGS